jgi:hypothetical protein
VSEWKIKRGDSEFIAADDATLKQWARERRVIETDLVLHPVLERWMYARELGELSGSFAQMPQVVITKQATSPIAMTCAILVGIAALFLILVLVLPMIFGK